MEVVLDLYNFDSHEAEGSKYVLTSPRSLEACSRLKIKPVELLQKSHGEFSQENSGKPLELIQILYNEWEDKRILLLQKCRQEREKIIMEQQVAKKKEKQRNINFEEPPPTSKKLSVVHQRKPTKSIFESTLLISDSHKDDADKDDPTNPTSPSANFETPRSRNLIVNKSDGLRSRSVEHDNRNKSLKLSNTSSRSLSVFGNNSTRSSGYVTPQIQRDRRLVELMKDRRKQDAKEEKQRRSKMLGWSKELKMIKEAKRKEELQRQKELASSHLAWERKLREEEAKKQQRVRNMEEERLHKQEQLEDLARINVEKQEKLRMEIIEEKKKMASERKQKQEKSLNLANSEILAHQQATEEEIKSKQDRAGRAKLEKEIKELQKVKLMNRRQQERIVEIQAELKRRQEADERSKREALGRKLNKAAENHAKKVVIRDLNMKNQGRQMNEKIDQTKRNLKRIDKESEEHKQSIVDEKNERTQKAAHIALETTLNKASRAKEIRTSGEMEWRKNLQLIHKRDKELIARMKESLELKDDKVKRHVQLKEAALEFSRVQAKINEAERESIKRKTTNFHQMAQKAKIAADIGHGPRSSFVNYSTVKLG